MYPHKLYYCCRRIVSWITNKIEKRVLNFCISCRISCQKWLHEVANYYSKLMLMVEVMIKFHENKDKCDSNFTCKEWINNKPGIIIQLPQPSNAINRCSLEIPRNIWRPHCHGQPCPFHLMAWCSQCSHTAWRPFSRLTEHYDVVWIAV